MERLLRWFVVVTCLFAILKGGYIIVQGVLVTSGFSAEGATLVFLLGFPFVMGVFQLGDQVIHHSRRLLYAAGFWVTPEPLE
jgi:hypothetical protein